MTGTRSKAGVTGNAPGAATATGKCGAEVRVADQVFVTLSCTLSPDHADDHYDEIFSRGWGR